VGEVRQRKDCGVTAQRGADPSWTCSQLSGRERVYEVSAEKELAGLRSRKGNDGVGN